MWSKTVGISKLTFTFLFSILKIVFLLVHFLQMTGEWNSQ
jgi:hypothetical protein